MAVLVHVGGIAAGIDEQGRVVTLEETPVADERVTVGVAAVGITPPPQANVAVIQALANPLRFRVNGQDPTAAIGLRMATNDLMRLEGWNTLTAFSAIREGAADATLEVHYFTQQLAVPPGQ